MARAVVWTLAALDDLDRIAEYIARDSPAYAAVFVGEARAASRSLRVFAERGRVVPEFDDPEIRELFVGSYRLIYRVGARIEVLTLVHGARDLAAFWSQRDR